MTENELKNCIFILYDMEQNLYMMARTVEKIDEEIKNTAEIKYPEIEKPKEPKYYKLGLFGALFFANPISEFICDHLFDLEFGDIYDFMISAVKFLFFAAIGILLLPVSLTIGIISYFTTKPKLKAMNERKSQEYANDCRKYEEKRRLRDLQINSDLKKIEDLRKKKESLRLQRIRSEEKLNEFYEKININEKFRGFLPMSYMAEFIKLGIATKLEGADGLYYLVLKELKDTEFKYSITEKLDEAVQKEQNLHKQLEKMKRTCDVMMMNTMNSSSSNTIDSYQSERIARELEYQTYLMKKGIYS